MLVIPEHLIQTTLGLHGEAGQEWLDRLPSLIAVCEAQWVITLHAPFAHLTYNYAAPATRSDGTAVVVKACFPDQNYMHEIGALLLFAGRGSVQLLEAERGVLLLEALQPGTPLLDLADDAAAITIATSVMRDLWRPAPTIHEFPTVGDWALGFTRLRARFDGGTGPLPPHLVARAESLWATLQASAAPPALLHGDLNFGNILAADRAPWLAIDPKGLVGEPAYEVGVLLRDPLPRILSAAHPASLLARRIDQLADELALDKARIHGWGLAQAVLSAWWSIEDNQTGWQDAIACAEVLATITV